MLRDVAWGHARHSRGRHAAGTGDAQLTLAQNVPLKGAVIISTPQDLSLIDARRGLAMFSQVNVPVLGIVENMSYFHARICGTKSDILAMAARATRRKNSACRSSAKSPLHMSIRATSDSGHRWSTASPTARTRRFIARSRGRCGTVAGRDRGGVAIAVAATFFWAAMPPGRGPHSGQCLILMGVWRES